MTALTNNVEKSSVTANSVVEKLKSLSSSISHKATEGMQEISSGASERATHIATLTQNTPTNTIMTIIRYIFIILLICFILLNILAVLGLLPPRLAEFFNPILLFLGHSSGKVPSDKTKQPVTSTDNIAKTVTSSKKSTIDKIEDIIDYPTQKLTDITLPSPDDISTDIQSKKSKSGYCYIGKDKGFRSCVKVDEQDRCMSGDIFPTKDICVNPRLRA